MRKIFSICLLFILLPLLSAHDGYLRNLNSDVIHYQYSLSLNDSTDRIEGKTLIRVKFLSDADSYSIDLKNCDSKGMGMQVKMIYVKDEVVEWKHEDDKLLILFNSVVKRNDTIDFVIEYGGVPSDGLIISKNKYGDRTFFADHWPDRAHTYLPCIDHPYDKASVDFIIIAPGQYSVVANGKLVEESDLADNKKLTHWKEVLPLPTKVMAFGVARFAVKYEGDVNNIPVWSWVYPQNRNEGFHDYSFALKPLEYYCSIIGTYPYKELANVQSKTKYGGLENAGAIFYSENSVTGMGKAEKVIAHEIAHQWFGDCVTEADWHHIWLSEGFATYLTSLYFASVNGEESLKSDMIAARDIIIDYYDKNATPVIDTTITDYNDLLNVNAYKKGAWILHMLRHKIGEENFIKGLQVFYNRFYNSNALSADFQNVMEDVSGIKLDNFFVQWLNIAENPELKIWAENKKNDGITEIFIEQTQSYLFEFNLELLIRDSSVDKLVNVAVKERLTRIQLPLLNSPVLIPDPGVHLLFGIH